MEPRLNSSAACALRYLPEHAREGQIAANHPELLPPVASSRSKPFTLDMPLDHFGDSGKTYKNYYYTDDTYWDKEAGPLFVEMGGEGGVGGARASERHRQHKALAISVEHRFYGTSMPPGNLSLDNLPFLTSRQALEDAAMLIAAVNEQFGLSS